MRSRTCGPSAALLLSNFQAGDFQAGDFQVGDFQAGNFHGLALALDAETVELQRVIVDLKAVVLVELLLEGMHRTVVNGSRCAAVETGEMVAVFFHRAVERFPAGEGAYLNHTLELERF